MTKKKQDLLNKRYGGQGPGQGDGSKKAAGEVLAFMSSARSVVIPGERQQDWLDHRDGVLKSLQPATPLEKNLADRVASLLWRLKRIARYEAARTKERIEGADRRKKPAPKKADWPMANFVVVKSIESMSRGIEARTALVTWLKGFDDLPEHAILEPALVDYFLEAAGWAYPEPRQGSPAWDVFSDVATFELSDHSKKAMTEFFSLADRRSKGKPGAFRQKFVIYLQESLVQKKSEMESARRERLKLQSDANRAKRAIRVANCLPDDVTAAQIVQSESSLHLQLMETMHELERLQTRKKRAPLVLDVTMATGKAEG